TERKAAPITPTFDTETINQLKQRKSFQVNLSEQIVLPTVAPQSFSSTISTSSGTIEESQLIEDQPEPIEEPDNQL
ncbi:MAG: hypothetical protein Q7R44_00960, partial [bacterium]|nr:hypothetical protein [bacterium]